MPGTGFATNPCKSSVEPGDLIVYVTVTCCHEVVSVACTVLEPTSVLPLYSWSLSLSTAPAVSARTQIEPVYVPAVVAVTQFGASWSVAKVVADVPVFVSTAAQLPL